MELFIDINNQLFYNLQKYQLKSTQQAKQHHDTLHSIQPAQYNRFRGCELSKKT